MSDPDFDSFPLAAKGRGYEDFEPGTVIGHHWGRTLTDADNVAFSVATCAWLPMHLNAEFARADGHRGAVLNPMLVLNVAVGLSVEDLSEAGGPFLGLDDCVFHGPVFAGDTITARSCVLSKRMSGSRPGVGIVTWRTEAFNQRDELVLACLRTNLVRTRELLGRSSGRLG